MTDFCANFFPEITGGDSGCVKNTIVGVGSCDDPMVITPTFDISAAEGNSIVCNADGIYAAAETLCYRISYSQSGDLCVTEDGCETYEFVKADSVISLESTYVSKSSVGGPIIAELVDISGTVYATATTAAGAQTATWSTTSITVSADTFLGIRITAVGPTYPGCSYSASFLACEPTSLFAPGNTTETGITTIDVETDGCITGTTSGSGTPLDPVVISLSTKLDTDTTNSLECRAGGFYAPAVTTSLTAGDNVTITGTGQTTTPFVISSRPTSINSGAGINLVGAGTTASPYQVSAVVSPDACNGLEVRANGLWSEDPDHQVDRFFNSAGVVPIGNANVGAYHGLTNAAVQNNDPCGRTQRVHVTYDWMGFAVRLTATGNIVVSPEYFNANGIYIAPGQIQAHGSTATRDYSFSGWSFTETFDLAPGVLRTFNSRYSVTASTGASFVVAGSFFTNQVTIIRHAI